MSVKPILFSTEMVRAILDGRKTVTRRTIKLPHCGYFEHEPPLGVVPPYRPGDILYVRETWDFRPDNKLGYIYRADYVGPYEIKWRPSIHMPKEAARLFLRVTGVQVERLQDIDGKGVFFEGIDNGMSNPAMGKRWENMQRMAFQALWDSTIKPANRALYGWDANPWVWRIKFERCEKPKGVK